jgi:co-chaperonin GroES (HSP10)
VSEIAVKETVQEATEKAKQIPAPSGYHILCMVPKVDSTFGSRIVKTEDTIHVETQTTIVLYVAKLGNMAYKDINKFPTGPWCKEGDFVITRAYSGTRLNIHGTEWRIINDDTVDAVVQDPRGIRRAG